jgi:hypothetical protein
LLTENCWRFPGRALLVAWAKKILDGTLNRLLPRR